MSNIYSIDLYPFFSYNDFLEYIQDFNIAHFRQNNDIEIVNCMSVIKQYVSNKSTFKLTDDEGFVDEERYIIMAAMRHLPCIGFERSLVRQIPLNDTTFVFSKYLSAIEKDSIISNFRRTLSGNFKQILSFHCIRMS